MTNSECIHRLKEILASDERHYPLYRYAYSAVEYAIKVIERLPAEHPCQRAMLSDYQPWGVLSDTGFNYKYNYNCKITDKCLDVHAPFSGDISLPNKDMDAMVISRMCYECQYAPEYVPTEAHDDAEKRD